MKDVMREYGKIAGSAAAGAFLLSLVVGLISRNLFAVAFARAVLFAFLFAGLGAAARFIVTKYLPEVAPARPAARERARGQTIDITLPEERPAPAAADSASGGLTHEPGPEAAAAPIEVLTEIDEPARPESRVSDVDLDDILPPLTDAEAAGEAGEAAEDFVEEAESVSEEGPADASTAAGGGISETGPEDLGRLPDISELGGSGPVPSSRGTSGGPSSRRSFPSGPGTTPEDEMKGTLGKQDPSTLARAIRTVLKRDEKG